MHFAQPVCIKHSVALTVLVCVDTHSTDISGIPISMAQVRALQIGILFPGIPPRKFSEE